MKKLDFIKKNLSSIYEYFITLFLSTSLVIALNSICEIKISLGLIILVGFISSSILILFNFDSTRLFIIIFLGFCIGITVLLFIADYKMFISSINKLINYISVQESTFNRGFTSAIGIILVSLTSIIIFLLNKFFPTRLIFSVLLFAGGILLTIFEYEIPKFAVFAVFLYIFGIIIEAANIINNRKISPKEIRKYSSNLLPICLACALVVIILPASSKPINWSKAGNFFTTIAEKFHGPFSKDNSEVEEISEFNPSKTGYSDEDKKLGGSLIDDDTLMLTVTPKAGQTQLSNIYLRGSISKEYTGSMWKKPTNSPDYGAKEYTLENLELFNSLIEANNNSYKNLQINSIGINYNSISTKTVFYPANTLDFDLIYLNQEMYQTADFKTQNIRFSNNMTQIVQYSLLYLFNIQEEDYFKQILINSEKYKYSNSQNKIHDSALSFCNFLLSNNINYVDKTDYSSSDYISATDIDIEYDYDINSVMKQRSKYIHDNYTILPDTIPDRVKNLAKDITRDCKTDYEKLEAIKNYLKKNYEYTKKPPNTKKGQDFVDFFLFDGKKGYCTYFATAMAVLGRCVDIPMRYVEGVLVDSGSFDGYQYLVKNTNAHAWTEAYFEGIGWITYDATPSNGQSSSSNQSYYNNNNSRGDSTSQEDLGGVIANSDNDTQTPEQRGQQRIINIIIIFVSAVLFVAIALGSFIFYIQFIKIKFKRKYEKLDNREKLILTFSQIIYYLKKLGYARKPDETILIFSDIIGSRFSFKNITFNKVVKLFSLARYAEREMTDGDLSVVNDYKLGLEQYIESRNNKLKSFFIKLNFLRRKIKST